MKKKKVKPPKISNLTLKQIVGNYIYATKLMFKIYSLEFYCQLFFWVSSNLLNFFSHTYMLRYVVNSLQEGKSIHVILAYVLFILIVNIVIESMRAVYDNIVLPIIKCRCERRLNIEIYQKSLDIDLNNYENPDSFEMYERAISNGADAIHDVIGVLGGITATLISASLDAWILYNINPVLFVFVVIPWLLTPFRMKIERKQYEYNIETQRINRRKDYTRRTFFQAEFAKEMRLTNLHCVMQRRFTEAINEYLNLVKTKGLHIAIMNYIHSMSISVISIRGAQIYTIFNTLVSGRMKYGDCLVVINTIDSLANTVGEVIYIFSDIYTIAMNIKDYRTFMEMEPKVSPNYYGKEPCAGNIEFKNVSFRYDGANINTLQNVNIFIQRGEHVAIVGLNGSGKTTLMKLLMRLYDPIEGLICVNGTNICEYKLKEYRRMYGVVFQDYKQLAFTIAENILGRPFHASDENKIWEALAEVGISDVITKLPKGIHTILTKEFDENGLVLSGGQSQKLAIASVYAREANTVIFDEPSSALDPLAEHQLYKNMLEISNGKTVIFISHRLSSCIDADRIYFMENGTVTESGNHNELMELNGKYAEMFRTQAQNYTE